VPTGYTAGHALPSHLQCVSLAPDRARIPATARHPFVGLDCGQLVVDTDAGNRRRTLDATCQQFNDRYVSRTIRDGKTRKQAEFKLVEADPERLVFEAGDEHVQRVVYQKEGERLLARIEGKHNGKPFTLEVHYLRMRGR